MKRRLGSVVVLSLFGSIGCGSGPLTPETPNAATKEEAKAPAASGDAVEFAMLRGGKRIGEETWRVTTNGKEKTYAVTSAVEAKPGVVIKTTGTVVQEAGLAPKEASLEVDVGGEKVSVKLGKEKGILTLRTKHGSDPEEVVAEKEPSDIIPLNPINVGASALCQDAAWKKSSYVAFPGAPLKVLSRRDVKDETGKTLGRMVVLDQGAGDRIEVGCEGEMLAVLRQPFQGIDVIRKGQNAFAEQMAKIGTRKKPEVPAGLVETERTIDVPKSADDPGATLACSVITPKNPTGKLPAVVFVTGSGPQDRDEDTPGEGGVKLSLFKTMAITLGNAGIASIRCDDRGTGASKGDYLSTTLYSLTRDARALVDNLRKDAAIDPGRIGIVGHSEGGVVATRVAVEDKKLKAAVLMSSFARPLADIVLLQLESTMKKLGMPDDKVKERITLQKAMNDAIKNQKPLPKEIDGDDRKEIEAQAPWLRSHFKNDPDKSLKAMPKIAAFAVQGGKDGQVPVEELDRIQKIFVDTKRPTAETKRYPELNHMFSVSKTDTMADYSDPDVAIDATFLSDVASFFKRTL